MYWLRWHYHVKDIAGPPSVDSQGRLYCRLQYNHDRVIMVDDDRNVGPYSLQFATERRQGRCINKTSVLEMIRKLPLVEAQNAVGKKYDHPNVWKKITRLSRRSSVLSHQESPVIVYRLITSSLCDDPLTQFTVKPFSMLAISAYVRPLIDASELRNLYNIKYSCASHIGAYRPTYNGI